VGLVWKATDQLEINATIGSAWRPPGVNERFSFGVHHGTAQFEIGEAGLKPEIATNMEVGLAWETDTGGVRFNAWNSGIRDFIQLRPDGSIVSTIRGAFPLHRYQQYDARLRGLELSLHAHPLDFFESGIKGSVLWGDNMELDEPLYMMPAPNLQWVNNISLPSSETLSQNTLQIGLRSLARQTRFPGLVATESYREPSPPSGYTLVDVGFSTSLQLANTSLDVSLDVKNMLNTRYRDYLSRFRYLIDEPGRNIVMRLALQF
jgi:iron complex outermembrane receptor protein